MKTITKLRFFYREFKLVAKGLLSTDHPVLAHIIPIRRCNLSCTYCNEYDDFSDPVPTELMFQRLDRLADLGTTAIIVSGGEPLMHPEIEQDYRAHTPSRNAGSSYHEWLSPHARKNPEAEPGRVGIPSTEHR